MLNSGIQLIPKGCKTVAQDVSPGIEKVAQDGSPGIHIRRYLY